MLRVIATLSTAASTIDEPAITQMWNPLAAPFGSLVASGLVAGSDLSTLLPLKVTFHPWSRSPWDPRFGWTSTWRVVSRFETWSPLPLRSVAILRPHEL